MRKKAVVLFLLRLAKIALGILNLSISAKYFGVSIDRDIWILAFNSMIILDMAIWGPINETFRAKFISVREVAGEQTALGKTKSLLLFTVIVSAILVIGVMIFPQIIAKVLAPTYSGQQLSSLLKMIVLVAPCFFVNQLVQILISLINAYGSFYIPELSSFVSVVLNLILIIFLAPIIGIYSLLLAYYVGVIILLALVIFEIYKLKIRIFSRDIKFKWNDFYLFIIFALPFFFPYFLGQINAIVEKTIASSLSGGAVSTLDYSRKFTEMFMGVLSSVLTTILVPILTLKYSSRKPREFVNEFSQIYQMGFLGITFIIAIFTGCPGAFVEILYNKGNINSSTLIEISNLTRFFSWGILSVFLYLIFGMVLLSSGQGKKYAFWGVIAQVIAIGINLIFFRIVGIYIFPLSLFVSHLLIGLILFKNYPFMNKRVIKSTVRHLCMLFLTVLLVYLTNNFILFNYNPYFLIILNSSLIGALILVQLFIFQMEERLIVSKFLKTLLRKND